MNFDTNFVEIFMMKIKKRIREGFITILDEYGLSRIHFRYIMALSHNKDGLTLKELSSELSFDRSNTTRAINDLIEKNYAMKNYKDGMKFKYKVLLTKTGEEIAKKLEIQSNKINDLIRDRLTESEINSLKSIIDKLSEYI